MAKSPTERMRSGVTGRDTRGGASDTAKYDTRCQNSLSAIIEFHGSGERRDLLVAPPAAFRHLQRVSRLIGHSPGAGDSAGMNISVDAFTQAFQEGASPEERCVGTECGCSGSSRWA